MTNQYVTEVVEPCITSAVEQAPSEQSDTQIPQVWRKALEEISMMCLGDFDLKNPQALVDRMRTFACEMLNGQLAEERRRKEVIQSVRVAVREGWEEARAIQEANKHDPSYVLGLRAGSNFVAMYVYRALHEVQP